jgi:signal transduction histidine kinase
MYGMLSLTRRLGDALPKWLRGYILAAALIALVTVTGLVIPLQGAGRVAIAIVFLFSLLAAAWWGGYGAGIVTMLYISIVAPRFIVQDFKGPNWIGVGELLAIVLLISWAADSRKKLGEINRHLDERVRVRTAELQQSNAALQEREALLLRQTEELARSNADLEQFAYIAAHDLQEPLRMVAVYTELFARKHHHVIDDEGAMFMKVVLDGVGRMESLLRDLMAYSRTIHAEPSGPERIETAEIIRVVLERLTGPLRESNADVEIGTMPAITGDRVGLAQVFQNLISNALKYRSDGPVKIRVGAVADENTWIFSVEDNGIGIHPDHHGKIFEPFKRLHGREYPGTGVGLAICRRVIERHGGRIWVESQEGRGATFRFTIPVEVESRARPLATETASVR